MKYARSEAHLANASIAQQPETENDGIAPPLPGPGLMTPPAAAAYLGVEPSTLAMWRSTKRYPLPYIKVGRLVYYRKSHLDAFLAARTFDLSAAL